MANFEKAIAEDVLKETGASTSALGLRFDRVVVRVLGRLRAFADDVVPDGQSVILTVSAPIRLPAKTADRLEDEITALLATSAPSRERCARILGNDVRLRLVKESSGRGCKLIGFVHNPQANTQQLLDAAERWLRDRV
jgi:hypothetical protein